MTGSGIQFRAPDRRKDRDGLFDLTAKVFSSGPGYYWFVDRLKDGYIDGSHYDWDASVIGVIDGVIVTHYGVWGYDMRIGSITVRCAGIGAVATHGEYRKRGLMAKTIPAAVEAMTRSGYELSILFGIKEFYHKFGYVRAWSRASDTVNVRSLPGERPSHTVRAFSDLTRDDVAVIYAKEHAGLTGTAVRPTYRTKRGAWNRWTGWRWVDTRGRTLGYVTGTVKESVFECYEVGGDVDEALRVLADLARRNRCREVKFVDVHEETPILKRVRRGDCAININSHRSGGPMIRTINLASTLEKMRGELSRRLKASLLATWRGKLLIADAREKVVLDLARGKVTIAKAVKMKHAIRGGDEIAQLLIGTNDPDETVEAAGMRLSGDAKLLIGVLFPAQHPRLCPWDGY